MAKKLGRPKSDNPKERLTITLETIMYDFLRNGENASDYIRKLLEKDPQFIKYQEEKT